MKTNRGFTVFARFIFFSKPDCSFLAIRKERQEMEFPIIIITRKRWRELEGRARRAESAVDGLARSVDELRGRLSAMTGIINDLSRDVRSLRRMLNKKEKKTWRFTGK
jgi:chromosome segregation ATPase